MQNLKASLSVIFSVALVACCLSTTYMMYALDASVKGLCIKMGGTYSFRGGCEFRSALGNERQRPTIRARPQ